MLVPAPNTRLFNEVVVGVMGRALEVSPLELCSAVWVANHFHLIAVVHEQQELSRFMQHLACNISKEVGGRIRDWRGSFWERRYDGIVISDEPQVQWSRLKYSLSHGVKEGLVASPELWPGVHSAAALVHGEPLEGFWWNRSQERSARNRGKEYGTYDFATRYLIRFAPLPAFRHLKPEEYQDMVAELIQEIRAEGEEARDGNPVAGVEKILSQDPYRPPTRRTKRSPRPLFHVKEPEVRLDLQEQLKAFLAQYWEASAALRSGNLKAADWFPDGCYPPALAFVGDPPPPRPPSPPTRSIIVLESGAVERGEIPVVEILMRVWSVAGAATTRQAVEPRSRGQPP